MSTTERRPSGDETARSIGGVSARKLVGLAGLAPQAVKRLSVLRPGEEPVVLTAQDVVGGFFGDPSGEGREATFNAARETHFFRPMRTPDDANSGDNVDPSVNTNLAVDISTDGRPLTISATASDSSPERGDPVTFNVQGAPAGVKYFWDFGDGGQASTAPATHAFAADGTYDAQISVVAEDGSNGSATVRVVVGTSRGGGATGSPTPSAASDTSGQGGAGGGGGSAATGGGSGGAENPATGQQQSSTPGPQGTPGPTATATPRTSATRTPTRNRTPARTATPAPKDDRTPTPGPSASPTPTAAVTASPSSNQAAPPVPTPSSAAPSPAPTTKATPSATPTAGPSPAATGTAVDGQVVDGPGDPIQEAAAAAAAIAESSPPPGHPPTARAGAGHGGSPLGWLGGVALLLGLLALGASRDRLRTSPVPA